MPQVQRHEGVERWIYDSARAYLTKRPRTGIHVSDLLSPRKAYWARVMPKPPTDREVLYFMAGRSHEETVMALADLGRYRKVGGEWRGITYEIDAVTPTDSDLEVPVELKTNRRPKIVLDPVEVLEQYNYAIKQLGFYVAIQNEAKPRIKIGYLITLHLMARNLALQEDDEGEQTEEVDPYAWLRQSRPELITYQIEWSDEELAHLRDAMEGGKLLFEIALNIPDHTVLPPCEKWMCGQEHVKKGDPYCPKCKTIYVVGEVTDGKKRGVFKKCVKCKEQGKRLDLIRPQETVFIPSCRWFAQCRPSENWPQYLDNFWKPSREAVA